MRRTSLNRKLCHLTWIICLLILTNLAGAQSASQDSGDHVRTGSQYPYVTCPQIFTCSTHMDDLHFHVALESRLSVYEQLWGRRRLERLWPDNALLHKKYPGWRMKLDVF